MTQRPYLLRGLIRCGICGRKMQAATIRDGTYYRCLARTLAPGSAVLADHPRTVNLREADVLAPLNAWIGELFSPENVDQTVASLVDSQRDGHAASVTRESAKRRVNEADGRLRRFQEAIAAGIDPAALVEATNEAQAQRAAAYAELDNAPAPNTLDAAEIYAMIDYLGDVGAALGNAKPDRMGQLYGDLRLQLRYEQPQQVVLVTASTRVASARVRGGTCILTTRLAVEKAA